MRRAVHFSKPLSDSSESPWFTVSAAPRSAQLRRDEHVQRANVSFNEPGEPFITREILFPADWPRSPNDFVFLRGTR